MEKITTVSNTAHLGEVKVGTKWEIHYNVPGEVIQAIPGCGSCTSIKLSKGKVIARFEVTPIPKHLQHNKKLPFKKSIAVKYSSGRSGAFFIKGTKTKKI